MSLTAYHKTYCTTIKRVGNTRTDTIRLYNRSIIIQESPSIKLVRWGGKKSKYQVSFHLQMPYIIYVLHGAAYDQNEKARLSPSPFIFFTDKPLHLMKDTSNIYTPPLGNVFAGGETCLEQKHLTEMSELEKINIFWEKNFNRDIFSNTINFRLWKRLQIEAGATSPLHVVKMYKYWENHLNTEEKILNFLSKTLHKGEREESNNLGNLLLDDELHIRSSLGYGSEYEVFEDEMMIRNRPHDTEIELVNYEVFDILENIERSQELYII